MSQPIDLTSAAPTPELLRPSRAPWTWFLLPFVAALLAFVAIGPVLVAFVSGGSVRWVGPAVALVAAAIAVVAVDPRSGRVEGAGRPVAEA